MTRWTLRAGLVVGMAIQAAGWDLSLRDAVSAGPVEIVVQGDFDGDGTLDVAVIDRADGSVRVATRDAMGVLTMHPAVSSGIADVSDASVGRTLVGTADRLYVTGADANRVHILDLSTPGVQTDPIEHIPSRLGPLRIAAVDIAGVGNLPLLDDLALVTTYDDPPNAAHVQLLRRNLAGTSLLDEKVISPDTPVSLDRVRLTDPNPPVLALLTAAPGECLLLDTRNSPLYPAVGPLTGVPANPRLLNARWDQTVPRYQFLFYTPGGSTVDVSTVTLGLTLGPPVSFGLANNYLRHSLVEFGGGLGFASLRMDQSAAHVYQFDGVNPPVPVGTIFAPPGGVITSLASGGSNDLVALHAPFADAPTHELVRYAWNGSAFVPVQTVVVPEGSLNSTGSQVFYFSHDPLRSVLSHLVATRAQPDWTRDFVVQGGGASNSVEVWTAEGGLAGLSYSNDVVLPVPAGVTAGWANQVRGDVSVRLANPQIGTTGGLVTITPPPGAYTEYFRLRFPFSPGITAVKYRFADSDPWQTLPTLRPVVDPPSVTDDFEIAYYGESANGPTRVYRAAYRWVLPPDQQDSDGDDVPDYVEEGLGLDPDGGVDTDEDGFTDLEELVAGTLPEDGQSTPADHGSVAYGSGIDLTITPQSHDGTSAFPPGFISSHNDSVVLPGFDGTLIRAYSPSGTLLGEEVTSAPLPPAPTYEPRAELIGLVPGPLDGFMAVSTPLSFGIQGDFLSEDQSGRELVGLVKIPDQGLPPVGYTYGGGVLSTEASNWVAAATAAYTVATPVVEDLAFDYVDSLHALICEKLLGELLLARGLVTSGPITLFPERVGEFLADGLTLPIPDRSRVPVDEGLLLALQFESAGHPAVRLDAVLDSVRSELDSGAHPGVAALQQAAADIYRIARTPSTTNDAYAPAVDALRAFLDTGLLPGHPDESYAAATVVSSNDLATAATACAYLLAGIPVRPEVDFEAEIVEASLDPTRCALVEEVSSGTLRYLVEPGGLPYSFPLAFPTPVGSRLQVRGYADRTNDCGNVAIEVVEITLLSLPLGAPPPLDANGNLLPDEWETLALGDPGGSALEDHDGDGFSDLHEAVAGSDPLSAADQPAEAPLDFSPPVLTLTRLPTELLVTWNFPGEYASRFAFRLMATSDLTAPTAFADRPLLGTHLGGDNWEVRLPVPAGSPRHYRFRIRLLP